MMDSHIYFLEKKIYELGKHTNLHSQPYAQNYRGVLTGLERVSIYRKRFSPRLL